MFAYGNIYDPSIDNETGCEMSNGHAAKGGQVGMNGEEYKGGQFLPSTTNPKRAAKKRVRGSGRVLVAPGVLDVAPEDHGSIFMVVRNFVGISATGALYLSDNQTAIAYYWSGRIDELNTLIERYNAGERWFKFPAA